MHIELYNKDYQNQIKKTSHKNNIDFVDKMFILYMNIKT